MNILDKKTFTLRLTEKQHRILEEKAGEQKLSKNEYIAKLLEEGEKYELILQRLDEIEDSIKKE